MGSNPDWEEALKANLEQIEEHGPLSTSLIGYERGELSEVGMPLSYDTPLFPNQTRRVLWDLDDSYLDTSAMHSFLFRESLASAGTIANFNELYKQQLWPRILEYKGKSYTEVLIGIHSIGKEFGIRGVPDDFDNFMTHFLKFVGAVRLDQIRNCPPVSVLTDADRFDRRTREIVSRPPAIFTASLLEVAEMMIDRAGVGDRFHKVFSIDRHCLRSSSKADPQAFKEIIALLGDDPSEVLYIGDSLDEALQAPRVVGHAIIRPHKPLGKLQVPIGQSLRAVGDSVPYHEHVSFVRSLNDIRFG